MKAWMRDLKISFISESLKSQIIIGTDTTPNMYIKVSGIKYLSTLKDNMTIEIKNLTYWDILRLIDGKYNKVEIKFGYKSSSTQFLVFKGYILNISNELTDKKTNSVYVICTSYMLGIFNKLTNLTLSSGINMYTALKYICNSAGIKNPNISESFKSKTLQDIVLANQTIPNTLENIISSGNTITSQGFMISSDSASNNIINILDANNFTGRVYKLTDKNIVLKQFPYFQDKDLIIELLPTFNLCTGDIVVLDNSLINLSISSKDEIMTQMKSVNYINADGQYIVYQIDVELSNRDDCSYKIKCRSKSLFTGLAKSEVK